MQDGSGPDHAVGTDVIAAAGEVAVTVEVPVPDDEDMSRVGPEVEAGEDLDRALRVEAAADEGLAVDAEDSADADSVADADNLGDSPDEGADDSGDVEHSAADHASDADAPVPGEETADAAADVALPGTAETETPSAPDHLALVADAERVLDAVDRAMARLRDGSYGTCEICNDAIVDTDLEADPTAERCSRHLPLADSA